ncbi:hypothetical protein [Paracoccus aminovorans]|uniref:hypothetical protein n=1 Tax=Paracoccus aminovorans TaxID=34004 RepID=UPI00147B4F40|nr:hypothetical protein [Paracoccus aminovorans]
MAMLAEDEAKRDRLPTPAAIEAEQAKVMQRFQRDGIPDDPWPWWSNRLTCW